MDIGMILRAYTAPILLLLMFWYFYTIYETIVSKSEEKKRLTKI